MIYLYVKQHSVTKLKYFGKTTRDPYTYLGSGLKWQRHINKHGTNHVETLQVWEFADQAACTTFALEYSKNNNIVESNEWANLKDEDGLQGWGIGNKHNLGRKLTEETKSKISNSHKGQNYLKGHIQTAEHIVARTISRQANGEWHSSQTKAKIQQARGQSIIVHFTDGSVVKLPSRSELGRYLGITSTTGRNILIGKTPKEKYNITCIETTK
jgi:NUMOD3 motif